MGCQFEPSDNATESLPVIANYGLFKRIFYQISIYTNQTRDEFLIVKGSFNGKERAENELKILKACHKCPYIIHLIGEVSLNQGKEIYIILPYFREGDLKTYFENSRSLEISQIKSIALNLFEAAAFLKKQSIVHRDIKCENILVSSSAYFFSVKLIDFEWGLFYDIRCPPKEKCGTFGYIAPEVLDEQVYSFGVDVWSIGVVLFFLCTGEFPFGNRNRHQEYIKNSRDFKYNDRHKSVRPHSKFKLLLKNIFTSQLSGRWSADQCLRSSWLQLNPFEVLNKLL